jgi:hypothetical protein
MWIRGVQANRLYPPTDYNRKLITANRLERLWLTVLEDMKMRL